jgi:hypothetical protein
LRRIVIKNATLYFDGLEEKVLLSYYIRFFGRISYGTGLFVVINKIVIESPLVAYGPKYFNVLARDVSSFLLSCDPDTFSLGKGKRI